MFIYNITTKVTWQINDAWLAWMKEVHTIEIINTGCFNKVIILQLLELDENDGLTYAVQYHTENKEMYNQYKEKLEPTFKQQILNKWGDMALSFASLMQVVN